MTSPASGAAASAKAKLAALLSRFNPIPSFPEYTGPFKVGTIDLEFAVAGLDSPSPAPAHAAGISTVQFRVFYPVSPDAQGQRISWLPAPQRSHVSAYSQFLGFNPLLASVVSFLPRHLYYTSIPALKDAPLLEPKTPSGRWPTMVFSHGLGGSRNAYSHIAGSVASHGVVVVCPEHRDGSAVISYMRPSPSPSSPKGAIAVPYQRIPHDEIPEVWEARDQQLRIRLWELGLVHECVLNMDSGTAAAKTTTAQTAGSLTEGTPVAAVAQFYNKLQVQNPGDIIWAGHSFGASSMVQLLKTTFYAEELAAEAKECGEDEADEEAAKDAAPALPLFSPRPGSRLRAQICEKSPTVLLDMWCFPLLSPAQRALFRRPLPVYADVPTAPGGTALLAVGSEAFYKWTVHLHTTAMVLSPNPGGDSKVVTSAAFDRPHSGVRLAEPNFFYVRQSAHLNQSDFGLLFPRLTRAVFGGLMPERVVRLNLRAILQMLRDNGVPVARTCLGDLVDGYDDKDKGEAEAEGVPEAAASANGIADDTAIFRRSSKNGPGAVDGWEWIDIVGLGCEAAKVAEEAGKDSGRAASPLADSNEEADNATVEATLEGERAMELEMEPTLGAAVAERLHSH